jgi:hypothetical protein
VAEVVEGLAEQLVAGWSIEAGPQQADDEQDKNGKARSRERPNLSRASAGAPRLG